MVTTDELLKLLDENNYEYVARDINTNYNSDYMKKGYDFLGVYSKEYSGNTALVINEKTSSTGVKMLSNNRAFFLVSPIRTR